MSRDAGPKLQIDLDGRVALVTGGGRGIGAAAARLLAGAGARVIVAARSADEIEAVAERDSPHRRKRRGGALRRLGPGGDRTPARDR